MKYFLALILFFTHTSIKSQICTNLGQTPPTAFPVCGTDVFFQQNVPICSTTNLFVPGCSGGNASYENKNPYWYKFTCYQSGTLGFTITPLAANEDYDWQLYDITGLPPNDVFTNQNIIVSGNWSGTYGGTGASASGVNFIQCASSPPDNKPTFAAMPSLIVGHNYLLLISHYSDTQSGYSLSFGGGTAVITDPLEPHLASASAPCDGTEIRVRTNKQMKCASLASNGSDFVVTDPFGNLITPIGASSNSCSNGFDLDSISVFLPNPLAPGTYSIAAKNGNDENTLLDNCDRAIPVAEAVQFTVFPQFPTPMDSVTKPGCAPQTLTLVFKKNIKCSSVDAAGTDFTVTGPYPVTVINANTNCANGLTKSITITLSSPMLTAGNFLVNLQTGADGNTIIDECGYETPLPDTAPFVVKDTVNADFTFSINYGCAQNVVSYNHVGANAVNMWQWSFGSAPNSNAQNPAVTYSNFEDKLTKLIVSNGVCTDTSSQKIIFENYINADFDVTNLICPDKKATFTNKSVGRNLTYNWTFGNGNTSTNAIPAPQSYTPLLSADYNAMPQLIIRNDFGCFDTISKPIQVVYSCFIAMPTAFTPNGDGLNDFLYPLKAYKSSNLHFSIYNRFGQRVFYSESWLNKWDGKVKTILQPPGTFVWMLDYINTETGKQVMQKGSSILIR